MDLSDIPLIARLTSVLELCAVTVIVGGVVVATAVFLRACLKPGGWPRAYGDYRANLGRGILLGLELLVAADIIATVTAPLTYDSLGRLAAIVLVRTFLSFALETEIEGTPPWRRRETGEGARGGSRD